MNHDPMTPPDDDYAAIRALLETLPRRQGGHAEPEFDDLVQWLEGTLPPARAVIVEAALARNPHLRSALTAARLDREEPVPPDEIARLDALVASPAAPVVPFPVQARRATRHDYLRAAAAAALLLAPAWFVGAKLADQRAAVETRQLREYLGSGLMRGGL